MNFYECVKDKFSDSCKSLIKTVGFSRVILSLFEKIRNEKISDTEVIKLLNDIPYEYIKKESCCNEFSSYSFRYMVKQFILDTTFDKSYNILDYGCNKGDFCMQFFDTPHKIYGCDILPSPVAKNFKYKQIRNNKLPYLSNYFDIITIFMVMHHITDANINIILDELYRICKQGGIIILRDHDATDNIKPYLSVLHLLYRYIWNKEKNWSLFQEYIENFKTFEEYKKMFEEKKFICIEEKCPYSQMDNDGKKKWGDRSFYEKHKNLCKNFHMIFMKI